ncbi:unnamed protein product [Adineta ricciae]|uniref:G-protein coupled receptors family 1 profile domain-containing protein n=1 Tax=Adineta ricciae TaxID=249248 RepID=A0A814T7L4_ADIRI|nr:unnamed protein product [Adineta ricciae]CAF1401822.1 unnamed protein product [Adineta ricciae]
MNQSGYNSDYEDVYKSPVLWMWLLAVFIGPSVVCYVFLLYHFFAIRTLRQGINNHIVIVVLILGLMYTLIDIASSITYYRLHRQVWPQSPAFCYFWLWIDYGVFNTITVLLAWGSFERHILVFHHQLTNTRFKRIIFHYIPMYFILTYMTLYYTVLVFFYPCQNDWDYNWAVCGVDGCYHENVIIAYFELYFHGIIPMIAITLFNIALLIRVMCHKRTAQQRVAWKKYRKMAFQLLSIVALYLSINFPLSAIDMLSLVGINVEGQVSRIISFLGYHTIMFLPFVCLAGLPEVWKKVKGIFHITTAQIAPFQTQPNNNH